MYIMKKFIPFVSLLVFAGAVQAQVTRAVNGVQDIRHTVYALTNATIVKDAENTITNATLLFKDGKIVAVGKNVSIPNEASVTDLKGKYIYPSFIDIYSDYGTPPIERTVRGPGFFTSTQFNSNTKGAYGWNQAIKPEIDASEVFTADDKKAKTLREMGFGSVLTHVKDGISRGTGAFVTLETTTENLAIIKEKASNHFSFNKGSSTQSYPGSLMGSIALLRQTFLDGQWYKTKPAEEGVNKSLQAWNENLNVPMIFEAGSKWNNVRADRIGDEFGYQFILKGGTDEYQRMDEMKASKATFILPLNFPDAIDADDPNDVRFVSLQNLKHWEMAPTNPSAFEKAGIRFALTSSDLRDVKQFWPNLRKAMDYGLTEKTALAALTSVPAQMLNVYNQVGSLDVGKLANFIVTNGPIFSEKTILLQNWVNGTNYDIKPDPEYAKGTYAVEMQMPDGTVRKMNLNVRNLNSADIVGDDTLATKFSLEDRMVKLSYAEKKDAAQNYRLSGVQSGTDWSGVGTDASGRNFLWTARYQSDFAGKTDSLKKKKPGDIGKLLFPNMAYGWETLPQQETILLKNGTVWTNESEGIVENTDVLIQNGKIARIGKNLSAPSNAVSIDATGKHITPGIIDEHSHIAVQSINEGGQSVTSEVRIGDNLDPDDIDIYRQLAGGVTTSHILHGSANTIGGQTQLIKLRWGVNDEGLKFKGADPFIKFALGENVKRTPAQTNNRFPDTRMGVEQVQMDAFTRAKDYENALKGPNAKNVRKDLELDALVEIMNGKRFITCHSYVASEILETMDVAEKFGFKINTFTHILEGYKVADAMKKHGVAASTFSDWWAYKLEVQDAIAHNAGIMHNVGLNVALNSDDAEMARRLNQEAGKIVKYSGINEEDALKMVTLNPAKMMHIDKQVGSLKAGKDADVVLWSGHPLSVYSKAEKTIVDGIVYFDREKDLELRKQIASERNRIVQAILKEKKPGIATGGAPASMRRMNVCSEHDHNHGLLVEEVQ